MATLYIVATPIGNLEDITLRAIRVLQEVDTVVCEDTRVTKKLLEKYLDAPKRVLSFHAHSDDRKVEELIALLPTSVVPNFIKSQQLTRAPI